MAVHRRSLRSLVAMASARLVLGPDRGRLKVMGYFSNGTEGLLYQEEFCFRCRNFRDVDDDRGKGCPVYDLHLLYNGEEDKESLLDFLIPRAADGLSNEQCSMFLEDV